jgi:predicted RNase H-like HicB family nuclease
MTDDALKYKNEWVAFSADFQRVVGHGTTTKDASDMAKEAGEEHAILFFIPEEWPDVLVL